MLPTLVEFLLRTYVERYLVEYEYLVFYLVFNV